MSEGEDKKPPQLKLIKGGKNDKPDQPKPAVEEDFVSRVMRENPIDLPPDPLPELAKIMTRKFDSNSVMIQNAAEEIKFDLKVEDLDYLAWALAEVSLGGSNLEELRDKVKTDAPDLLPVAERLIEKYDRPKK